MSNDLRLISRSSHEALFTCPRKYYWGFEYAGTGLDASRPSTKLLLGIAVHQGLEEAMRLCIVNGDGSLVAPLAHADAAMEEFERLTVNHAEAWVEDLRALESLKEEALLAWALVYTFTKYELPRFVERFEVLEVEEEWRTPLSPKVVLMSRVDVLVRERATGFIYVVNWKTTDKKDPQALLRSYAHDSQMWAEALAAEQRIGEPVQGTLIIGLYKGVIRSYQHATPLLYAYSKEGVLKSSYTQGWAKIRADQLGEGGTRSVATWIDRLPEETRSEQFITLDPILKIDDVVEERLKGWVYREEQADYILHHAGPEDQLLYFGARDGYWCEWCPFRAPCKGGADLKQMVAEGLLVAREDHHEEKEKKEK